MRTPRGKEPYNDLLRRSKSSSEQWSPKTRPGSTLSFRSERISRTGSQDDTRITSEEFENGMAEAIRVAELKKKDDDKPFTDEDFNTFSRLLRQVGRESWGERPRTYIVLRLIDQVHVMNDMILEGCKDVNFPYEEGRIPPCLKGITARRSFLQKQTLVFSSRTADLVQGGAHRHISKSADASFKVIRTLGRGGYGEIDQVRSRLTLQEYARKRIRRAKLFAKDKHALKSFENEIHNLKRLEHHHLVRFVGSYTDAKYVGIIMEPVADTDLRRYLMRIDFPSQDLANLRCFIGCLSAAVLYLHQQNCRHKDLKPGNILIYKEQVMITDFGTALDWTELNHDTTVGKPGAYTTAYAAPEVAQERPRNTKADIWSLGLVFLDILTVLKGFSLDEKKAFFETNGTNSAAAWKNRAGLDGWIELLAHKDHEHAKPVSWVKGMTAEKPSARPDAATLHQDILDVDDDDEHTYCGLCCTDAVTTDGSSWHGSDGDEDVEASQRTASVTLNTTESEHLSPVLSTNTFVADHADSTRDPQKSAVPPPPRPPMRAPPPLPPRPARLPRFDWQTQTSTGDGAVPSTPKNDQPAVRSPSAKDWAAEVAVYASPEPTGVSMDISSSSKPRANLSKQVDLTSDDDSDQASFAYKRADESDSDEVRDASLGEARSRRQAGPRIEQQGNSKEQSPPRLGINAEVREEGSMEQLQTLHTEVEQSEKDIIESSRKGTESAHNEDSDHSEASKDKCGSDRHRSDPSDAIVALHRSGEALHGALHDPHKARSPPADLTPVHVRTRRPSIMSGPRETGSTAAVSNDTAELLTEKLARLWRSDAEEFDATIGEARSNDLGWRGVLLDAIPPTAENDDRQTMLMYAVSMRDDGLARDLTELYIQAGAEITYSHWTGNGALHHAAYLDRPNLVKYLLKFGAEADRVNLRKQTALHIATRENCTKSIPLLLKALHPDAINRQDDRGQTALHLACSNGSLATIQILVDAGADVDIGDRKGLKPIDLRQDQDKEDLQALFAPKSSSRLSVDDQPSTDPPSYESLTAGSAPDTGCVCEACLLMELKPALQTDGKSLLECACVIHFEKCGVLTLSDTRRLKKDLRVCSCSTCTEARLTTDDLARLYGCACSLCEALGTAPITTTTAYEGHEYWDDKIKAATQDPCDCNQCATENTNTAISALVSAGFSGKKSYRMDPGKVWNWAVDNCGTTASIIHVVQLLLDAGANINSTANKGFTMLHAAAIAQNMKLAKVLISRGATIDVERQAFWADKAYWTPLHYAFFKDDKQMVRLLLREGATIDKQTASECEAILHMCIRFQWTDDWLPMILAHDPLLDLQECSGRTPLQLCVYHDQKEAARLLLEAGADIELATNSTLRPLAYAIDLKKVDLVGVLLTYGANTHATRASPSALHRAAAVGHGQTILRLLEDEEAVKDINNRDVMGRTPLHIIADGPINEIMICVDEMIEAGADVKIEDIHGSTPLHAAAKAGSAFLATALISAGAFKSALNHEGKTPLDFAMSARHREVVELLGGKLKKKKWYRGG